MADGQSAGRISASRAVIGGQSRETPPGRGGRLTSQVTFSLANLLIKKKKTGVKPDVAERPGWARLIPDQSTIPLE